MFSIFVKMIFQKSKQKQVNMIFTQQILESKKHAIYKTPKTQFVSCLFLCDV